MTRRSGKLSVEAGLARYSKERRQGQLIVERCLEGVWGWSSPAGRLRADRRAAFLVNSARLSCSVRCLELGCGTGEFTFRLAESGCHLFAVDLSEAAVGRSRERVRGRAEVVVGNVETGEGIPRGPFDAVVGVSVLHHVNLDSCLRTVLSVLRPGGRFAFTEPNMANPQVWAERNIGLVRRWRHVTPHETAFLPSELRRAFEGAGLTVEVCEPFDFLHPSTPAPLIGVARRLEAFLERTPLRGLAGSVQIAGCRPARAPG
jgi:SAM-dependent methyltransferase